MRALRLAIPGLLLALGACAGEAEPPWVQAICSEGTVQIRGAAPPGTFSTLSLARPRAPDRAPKAATADVAFAVSAEADAQPRILARVTPQDAPAVEVTVPLAELDAGWSVVQWVVQEDPRLTYPIVAVSAPVYLLPRDGGCEVLGLRTYLWRSHRETWLVLAAAVALVLLRVQRWVPPRPLAILVAISATGAALIFVGMRAASRTDQKALEGGVRLPNFIVTPSWQFGDDSEERVLGPGFRELAGMIHDHLLPGEKLYFHICDDELRDVPEARARASYLRREFPDGEMVFFHEHAGPGLSVHFGSTPGGTVLARGSMATLARIEAAK